jgi:hypothetical protein
VLQESKPLQMPSRHSMLHHVHAHLHHREHASHRKLELSLLLALLLAVVQAAASHVAPAQPMVCAVLSYMTMCSTEREAVFSEVLVYNLEC